MLAAFSPEDALKVRVGMLSRYSVAALQAIREAFLWRLQQRFGFV